jgi:phosphatidylserine/phosphatidylglycerophosphate/cardiolipin synthase-like enzyme
VSVDFIRQRRAVELALLGGRGHYEAVVERVMAAERSVWIATANLKELMVEDARAQPGKRRNLRTAKRSYRSALAVFEEQVLAGVEIRLLHAGEPSRPFRAELRRRPGLRRAGGPAAAGSFEMRQCPRVHFKAVVIDGAELYLGSANWTGAGLGAKGQGRRNFELGFLSRDDLLLDEVQGLYDQIWRGAHCAECRLRAVCPRPLDAAPPAAVGQVSARYQRRRA